jgi:mRNA-degrading endonuclease toxin of MazEF toxin-antitoxin module
MINPKRGEIWLVDLSPTRGQEIQKTRPVVIIQQFQIQKFRRSQWLERILSQRA